MSSTIDQAWTREEFEAALRGMETYYHIHHPYHLLMNEGKLSKQQLQGWVRAKPDATPKRWQDSLARNSVLATNVRYEVPWPNSVSPRAQAKRLPMPRPHPSPTPDATVRPWTSCLVSPMTSLVVPNAPVVSPMNVVVPCAPCTHSRSPFRGHFTTASMTKPALN